MFLQFCISVGKNSICVQKGIWAETSLRLMYRTGSQQATWCQYSLPPSDLSRGCKIFFSSITLLHFLLILTPPLCLLLVPPRGMMKWLFGAGVVTKHWILVNCQKMPRDLSFRESAKKFLGNPSIKALKHCSRRTYSCFANFPLTCFWKSGGDPV